ncbi:MAG: hypothetical protein JW884_04765 [Deltaproteobacteria bacterium]|nr:hypothetical protein [Deltaproteobacteria bacterium]
MDNFLSYLSNHPVVAIILAAFTLALVLFIFFKLLKWALIIGVILLVVAGYFYYKSPEEFPKNLKATVQEVKEKSEKIVETGKEVVEKGKSVAENLGKVVQEKKK